MLRLALVGGVTFGHTRAFLGLFNPRTPAGEDQMPYPHQPDLPGRVVAIADPAQEKAHEFASWVEGVEFLTANVEELAGRVDAVLVCGDPSGPRLEWARWSLGAGLPTFVDKPLATEVPEAEALIALAQATGTPLMSASALRFSRELAAVDRDASGDITTVLGVGPEDLFLYGVHVAEFIQAALGPGVQTVRALGTPEKYHIFMDWGPPGGTGVSPVPAPRKTAVWLVGPAVAPGFRMILVTERANLPLTIADSTGNFGDMLRAFCRMVESGQPPIPYENMLEIVRILDAARWSREMGGEEVRIGVA
jgi:hypothetical protein